MEGSDRRWRGGIAGGRGEITGGGEISQVEGSVRIWRGDIANGRKKSQVKGRNRR